MYNKFVTKLQESLLTLGAKKRIEFMTQHMDITPGDILLDVGGNTGKITQIYAKDCKEIVILEPKQAVVEYGRTYRPHIQFVKGRAENIPLPSALPAAEKYTLVAAKLYGDWYRDSQGNRKYEYHE